MNALAAQITAETLELAKAAFAKGPTEPMIPGLSKAGISTADGLVGINLEAPAKNLYPVYSPLRNRIPRKKESIGSNAVMWKAILGINVDDVDMGVPEGTRNSAISIEVEEKTAAYKSLGLDDSVTIEAIQQGKGFQDVRATAAMQLLYSCMMGEERIILGGNKTDLGAPAGLAGAGGITAGATLVAATDYDIKAAVLTLRGWRLNENGSTLSKTGAAALADGESTPSAKVDVNTGGGNNSILATVTAKKGAVGYTWYIATNGGVMQFAGFTTVNAFTYTEVPVAAQPNATDETGNALVYDGIIYQIENGADDDLFVSKDNAQLTAGDGASISEFESMLKTMWNKYRLGPTKILCHADQSTDITEIITGGTAPASRIVLSDGQKNITGSMYVGSYLNRYASAFAEGVPNEIPIFVHPDMPPGTILFYVEQVPYPTNQIPAVWELSVLQEYTQYDWAMVQRKYEFGIYHMAVLKGYFNLAQGAIVNIKPGHA